MQFVISDSMWIMFYGKTVMAHHTLSQVLANCYASSPEITKSFSPQPLWPAMMRLFLPHGESWSKEFNAENTLEQLKGVGQEWRQHTRTKLKSWSKTH